MKFMAVALLTVALVVFALWAALLTYTQTPWPG
jgi:hypothetical protein